MIEQPIKLKKYIYENDKPKQVVWDTSSLSTFSSCPRLYNLTNLQGYRMKAFGMVTGFGSAIHDAFEILDNAKCTNKSKKEAVRSAVIYILKNYAKDFKQVEDKARGLEAALRVIVWRAEEYWEDNIKIARMPDGTPCLEQRFEIPFGNTGKRFSGRIDKIVEFENNLYLCDTKTTKASLSDSYFRMYQPSNQVYAYLWAARNILGLDVRGFIIDAVQTGVHFCRFNRAVFNVNQSSLVEWYNDAQYSLSVAETYHAHSYYPANFTSCGNFGGCKFREVCSEPPEHRSIILREDFEVRLHDDLVRDGEVIDATKIFQARKDDTKV